MDINPALPIEILQKIFGSKSILNEDNYFQYDTFHQSKDGQKILVNIILKIHSAGNDEKCLLSLAKVKNNSLQDMSDKDNSDYLSKICDFYFDLDKHGRQEYVSPELVEIFGYQPEDIIGNFYFDCLPIESRAEAQKTFEHFSALAQPFRIQHEKELDSQGEAINCDLYFTPNFNDNGNFIGYRVLGWLDKNLG